MKINQRKQFFTLLFLFSFYTSFAQLRIGEWRAFPTFRTFESVSIDGDAVWGASKNAAFKISEAGEISTYTKLNGLGDVDINLVKFSNSLNTTIITYKSGIIDLFSNNTFYSIKSVQEKRIGDISYFACEIVNQNAYLATDFALLNIDLERQEVRETMFLGAVGEEIPIKDVCHFPSENALYIATDRGLLKGLLDGRNLMDFANWEVINTIDCNKIEFFNGNVFGVLENEKKSIYRFNGGNWNLYQNLDAEILNFAAINDHLFVDTKTSSLKIDSQNNSSTLNQTANFSGQLTNNTSLQFNENGYYRNDELIEIGLPIQDELTSIEAQNNQLWLTGEDLAAHFNGETWWTDDMDSYKKVKPDIENSAFFISDDGSLFRKNESELSQIATANYTDLAFDETGTLWLSNNSSTNQIVSISSDNEQSRFTETGLSNIEISNLNVLSNGDKWMLADGRIYVYNEQNENVKLKTFIALNEDADPISSSISCLALDKDFSMWCGTDDGVILYPNPGSVLFQEGVPVAFRVIAENDGQAGLLLNDNQITTIAIDGGNRKWIGTETAGVFLVEDDGSSILNNYTASNSSLPSNNVQHISIDNLSGEVFISTTNGMISYRAEAIEGKRSFASAYVFPNPVRPDYEGLITITGLMTDTELKITDTVGNLVHEAKSTGGQAIWDGKNLRGERVATGVYFIFLVAQEGEVRETIKLLFIN